MASGDAQGLHAAGPEVAGLLLPGNARGGLECDPEYDVGPVCDAAVDASCPVLERASVAAYRVVVL